MAESVAGLQKVSSGQIFLEGQEVTNLAPAEMFDIGLAYIPEDRMHDGVVKDFSVAENFILQDHVRKPYSNGIFLNFKQIEIRSKELIDAYNVKTPNQDTPVKNLSGGNIQKLILARELARQPRVIIAAQPTRGVDIGATEYIHAQLLKQRSEGLATLLISEDLDEVMAMSDRIMVFYGGAVMGIVDNDQVTIEQLGLMMAGEDADKVLG
jgi:simple sugar transport system ATP-binding protein